MPIDVPNTPKVYTTTYDSFRGVDFTNDATNVWRKRSPDGLNMLPDDAGRPMKRHGWVEEISDTNFIDCYNESLDENEEEYSGELAINRCFYFELAGLDHIVIFTNIAVFCYRQSEDENVLTIFSKDADCIASYDRTFFFEANGTAGFYIYGGYKVWRYIYGYYEGTEWVENFRFEELGQLDVYIPLIRVATSADGGVGTLLESVNLLGSLVKERFQDNLILDSDTGTVDHRLDFDKYAKKTGEDTTFTYTSSNWKVGGNTVTMSDYGITVTGTPSEGNTINVTLKRRTNLAFEVDVTKYGQFVVVTRDDNGDYTNVINVVSSDTDDLSTGECKPMTQGGKSWIEYYDGFVQTINGEDEIEVMYPRDNITHITVSGSDVSGQASIITGE